MYIYIYILYYVQLHIQSKSIHELVLTLGIRVDYHKYGGTNIYVLLDKAILGGCNSHY